MDITQFNSKLNKLDGNIYTIEEVINPIAGVYEKELAHDNVEVNTINIYTGSKLTGTKINTYTTSTPSLTPWKTIIKIFSTEPVLYITYETTGDTVEAEDINNLQDSVNLTQEALNAEIDRAIDRENTIENNLNKEIDRAKTSENTITTNLNSEITRATNAENTLTDNLSSEINRAKAKESQIDNELANRYTKDKVYTKEEVLQKIEALINNAPDVLDTFKEIADALGNDPNFATTMTTMLAGKVDKVTGKVLSTNDFSDDYKNQLIDSNNKKHTHDNKSIIDTITSALISNWNSAFTHISDTIKHITSAERTLWNTVSDKLNLSGGTLTGTLNINNSGELRKGNSSRVGIVLNGTDEAVLRGGKKSVKITATEFTFEGYPIYHTGNKPTPADIGASATRHTHDDIYYTETEIDSKISTLNTSINGKANSSHTHTKNQITDMPTKLSQFTNDEGFLKQADIDISQNHTHSNKKVLDKITQSSLNSWDDGVRKIVFVGSDAESSNGWYKVASQTCSGYGDTNITFMVTSTYANYNVGILQLQIRSDSTNITCRRLSWLSRIGLDINHYIVKISGMTWTLYAYQPNARYGRLAFEILSMSDINKKNMLWTLTFSDNAIKETTTPTATVKSSDGSTVASATKAIQDSDGNQINTTYVKKGTTWNELEGI